MNSNGKVPTTVPDTGNQNTFRFKYIPSFDIIRGIATICVLLVHASYGVIKGGWIGVDLFFVLSGFLITSLLQKEFADTGRIAVLKFYARRIFRLLPGLVLCILLANILWAHNAPQFHDANRAAATAGSLFYYSNFLPGERVGTLVHLWSLCVEEHFYLVWPLFTGLLLFRMGLKRQLTLIILIIVIITGFKIFAFIHPITFFKGAIVIDTYRNTFCRIDGILSGALLSIALFNTRVKEINLKPLSYNIAMAITAVIFIGILFKLDALTGIYPNGGFIFTNLLCAVIIFLAFKNPVHFIFSNKYIRWVGTRSYGIYIYHYPIFAAFEFLRTGHSVINLAAVTVLRLAVSFIAAELSFRYVEQPVLRFKANFTVEKVSA